MLVKSWSLVSEGNSHRLISPRVSSEEENVTYVV